MAEFIPWDSRTLNEWSEKFARGKFITLDGRSTHYIEQGQGDPVILIHGFNMDLNTWLFNIEALAEHHRVYAFDLWGLGYSTREPLDYGYDLYVEQLSAFMDALDIQKASLIGHSMGGGTAIKFGLENSERVNKLVLVDAAGLPSSLPLRAKLFTLPGVGEFLLGINSNFFRRKNLQDLWIYDKDILTEKLFDQLTKFQKIKGTKEVLMLILRKEFFHTLGSEIGQLGSSDIPIMILWGRDEVNISLEKGQEMHRILEGSRLDIIDRAGHTPNLEHPEQFNNLVLDFL